MVRTYKRTLGARQYKDYTEEQLKRAVSAIRNGQLGYTEAANTFNIPRRTLVNKVKRKHLNAVGAPQIIAPEIERSLVDVIIASSEYGCPLTMTDLRVVLKAHLDKEGIRVYKFKNNMPGIDWGLNFITRHKHLLSNRNCQNIKRVRAEKTETQINEYFDNLEKSVSHISPDRILNYDETNITDDPGSKKCIFRRGIKYPERVLNSTKTSISIMFAATADGTVLPPYTVYKAERIYDAWCIGGPPGARYNRTKSGWFDQYCFEDWFDKIVLPWTKTLQGPKILIGDNLSSHLNISIIRQCQKNDIRFVFLPSNSTHLTQPLDISFFKPLKASWRNILTNYKLRNPRDNTLNKSTFPILLKKLMEDSKLKEQGIVKNGFKAAGICPFNRNEVLKRMPIQRFEATRSKIDDTLLTFLKETRSPSQSTTPKRKKMIRVEPGKSVSCEDFPQDSTNTKRKPNEGRKSPAETDIIEDTSDLDEPESGISNQSGTEDISDEEFTNLTKTDLQSRLNRIKNLDFILVALPGKKQWKYFVAQVINKEDGCCNVKYLKKRKVTNFIILTLMTWEWF